MCASLSLKPGKFRDLFEACFWGIRHIMEGVFPFSLGSWAREKRFELIKLWHQQKDQFVVINRHVFIFIQ